MNIFIIENINHGLRILYSFKIEKEIEMDERLHIENYEIDLINFTPQGRTVENYVQKLNQHPSNPRRKKFLTLKVKIEKMKNYTLIIFFHP